MPAPRTILCPVDFSEASSAALDEALIFAEAFDAKIDLLHVWQLPTGAFYDGVVLPDNILRTMDNEAAGIAREQMKRLVDSLPEARRARVKEHVMLGYPATAILEHATTHGCDLIVMGTHGRRGATRFLIGSVAERVVRHAPCPVLTVRRHEAHAQARAAT